MKEQTDLCEFEHGVGSFASIESDKASTSASAGDVVGHNGGILDGSEMLEPGLNFRLGQSQ